MEGRTTPSEAGGSGEYSSGPNGEKIRNAVHTNFRERFVRARAVEMIGRDDGVMVDLDTMQVRRDHTSFKSPGQVAEVVKEKVSEKLNESFPDTISTIPKNADREWLCITYGILISQPSKSVDSTIQNLKTYLERTSGRI